MRRGAVLVATAGMAGLMAFGVMTAPSVLSDDDHDTVGAKAAGPDDPSTAAASKEPVAEVVALTPYDDRPPVLPYRDPAERWEPDPSMLPIGTEWVAVVQGVLDVRAGAYRHADVRPLGDVFTGRCGCMRRDMEAIKDLARRGLRFDGDAPRVLDAEVKQRPASDAVVVRATVQQDAYEMRHLDTDEVAWVATAQEPRVIEVAMLRSGSFGTVDHGDGRWAVVALGWSGRRPRLSDRLE